MDQLTQTPPVDLNPGEIYAGGIIQPNGSIRHVILLPGDACEPSWQASMDWAKSVGGDLPDRVEQSLLFSYLRDEFRRAAYWSNTQHEAYSGCAWFQHFGNGSQGCGDIDNELRARAVRRLEIQ